MTIKHMDHGWEINGTYSYAGSPHLLTAIVIFIKLELKRRRQS